MRKVEGRETSAFSEDDARELCSLPPSPKDWHRFYRKHLMEFVVPFWLRHGIDRDHGGLFTCLDDAGTVLSTDKYWWSQARALWTFSALYRRVESRADFLDLAHRQFDFCRQHGRDKEGRWYFRATRDGTPIDGPESIVTDCFAIYGLTEYARITQNDEAINIALETFDSVNSRIRSGRSFGTSPYPLPAGMKAHRYAMQCSLAFHELGRYLDDSTVLAAGMHFTNQVLDQFLKPDLRALLEYVNDDGSFSDTPAGRAVVPGHAIESLWFQIQILRENGDRTVPQRICDAIRWSIERGWDEEYGGLLLGLDIFDRKPPFWKFADAKLWWPAAEAMCATLYAYEIEGDAGWLTEHARIARWALSVFPHRKFGEWRNRLRRDGTELTDVVALPVKDPFHLPRALITSLEVLQRVAPSLEQAKNVS